LEEIKAEQVLIKNMLTTVLRRQAVQVPVGEELPSNIALPLDTITSINSIDIDLVDASVERLLVSI